MIFLCAVWCPTERAGAGQYFIQLAFALLGHFRGPAKAAVVASGLSGLYSGSSIANVVTTGFTIPLMKTGFTAEKAAPLSCFFNEWPTHPSVMGAAPSIAEFTGTPISR